MIRSSQKAFTLIEVLISLTLIGILASMLLPMLYNNVGKDKLLSICKNDAAGLSLAYSNYLQGSTPTSATSAQDIVSKMNYVRIVNDGSLSTQVEQVTNSPESGHCAVTGSPCAVYTTPCDATTPCVLLQDGAVLQYDSVARFGGSPPGLNTNAMRFILDPDAEGPQPAVSLMLFFGGRISTRRFAPNVPLMDRLPESVEDPFYALDWTNG